ncbi:hypothetical protein [Hymenobacter siberiensis]|uniref:hypothetical protein n=1 Tax=Hymenobacter siberiensis TaxID=2848396 RepID=UPI001C1DFCBB|nr:hypothetical protein [Hymenobacter siberiensis]
MKTLLRFAPLALVALPLFSHAQQRGGSAVGLEIPASPAPATGHWLAGAYVTGSYAPVLAPGLAGYSVQPYLRYVLGKGERARPFVQYSLSPYWVQPYGSYAPFGGADGSSGNPVFAPLPLRGAVPNSFNYNGYGGGLGSLSVGMPVRVGSGTMTVHVAGSLLSGLLR